MNSPRFSILVAMAKNRVIGRNNALPWQLSPDLKRFKQLTMGHHIVMGRKTYESIGRPLPGRISVIVSRQSDYQAPGAIVVGSIAEALKVCNEDKEMDQESFVIGGAEIYQQALGLCQRMYVTEIQQEFDGDALFPEFNQQEWHEISREKHRLDGDDGLEYHFVVLDRKI
ncbi:MAG: dihydrofolate reductase [Nitrosospira sp.]|nr:dihydrofolate reductase [Nitrosospira sp.]